ncbi:MAG: SDR family oxidoreductase [Solirubrobacteraceae bacterium]
MIAVAGGTGRLGTRLVRRLTDRGLPVRVLTRDPSRAQHLAGAAEIVTCDVRDRASLPAALHSVATVVSAVHGFAGPGRVSPKSVDQQGNANLIDAAAEIGADVVLMSVVGASAEHSMELFRAKHAAEEHLRASGVGWTIVRATAFVELWAEIMTKPIVFGRGENPINFVSVDDVAAVLERAVMDAELRGRVIEVGGPQNLTFNELAGLLGDVRGRPAKVRHVPRRLLRAIAPFARQPRAALAMDTIDMTFDAPAAAHASARLPMTDIKAALTRAAK